MVTIVHIAYGEAAGLMHLDDGSQMSHDHLLAAIGGRMRTLETNDALQYGTEKQHTIR